MVVLLWYFEARGRIKPAIAVIQKRTGALRVDRIGARGLTVDAPFSEIQESSPGR
jgi:hypothetical protein